MIKTLFWVGFAVSLLVVVWLLLPVEPPSPSLPEAEIRFEGNTPWIIGDSEDAFAYAGEGAHTIEGTALLRIHVHSGRGLLECALTPNETLIGMGGDAQSPSSVILMMPFETTDQVWMDQAIFGTTGIGESRLPETIAQYAGTGSCELLIDGSPSANEYIGFWSIAHALRQSDGSIRDRGLVFSPLLRDRSRFSDPQRTEMTILVYPAAASSSVLLHLVFSDVHTLDSTGL